MSVEILRTDRLKLRAFRQADAGRFFALNSDPDVMADLGGPLTRHQSDVKLLRYINALAEHGTSRLALETEDGVFLGYTGVMKRHVPALGWHYEIGWRLTRTAWGKGFVSEAARRCLTHVFNHLGLQQVLAYTGPDNERSQKVMTRLNLVRRADLDFSMDLETKRDKWFGLVWSAEAADWV